MRVRLQNFFSSIAAFFKNAAKTTTSGAWQFAKNHAVILIAAMVTLVFAASFYWILRPGQSVQQPPTSQSEAKTQKQKAKPTPPPASEQDTAKETAVATQKQAVAFSDLLHCLSDAWPERSLIKQLKANSSSLIADDDAEGYGRYVTKRGLTKNPASLKQWAGWEAHRLWLRRGGVDLRYGAEMRSKKEFAILIENKDGKLSLVEYYNIQKDHDGLWSADGMNIPQLTQSVQRTTPSHFLGWPGAHNKIPPYLYVYTG